MSRGALSLSAGLLISGLSAPALADEHSASAVALLGAFGGATIVDEMPYDYPPPYTAAHPYFHPGYHRYTYRYRHYATSPYHRHSGIEPYSYYYPEK